jgi:hypothetical protein
MLPLDWRNTSSIIINHYGSKVSHADSIITTTRNSMANGNNFPNRIIVIHASNRNHLWAAPVGGYDTVSMTNFTAIMIDDDTAGVTQSATSATIAESATGTYTVVLDSEPTSDVTIRLTSSDPTAATVTPLLTFTRSNWSSPQMVTITGVNDGDTANETVVISHAIAKAYRANIVTTTISPSCCSKCTIAVCTCPIICYIIVRCIKS